MKNNSPLDYSHYYCVIGAGPAGLLAARSLKKAGIPYHQFERDADVGGIWDIYKEWTPMYESAHFISSKDISHLPGYPMPRDYPDYPRHDQIFAYVKAFAHHYDLYPSIQFNTSIEKTEQAGSGWEVTFSNGEARRYRGLFLCSGNTWDPNFPTYRGDFSGESIHSVKYRSSELFKGKRVLIVGGGNSGCDIACDAAIHAKEATISLRRGYHFIPKHIFGIPADAFVEKVNLPLWMQKITFPALLNLLVGDLKHYGLPAPDHRVMESHPIMNTQMLHYLAHGDLQVKPDIDCFNGQSVIFKDGSALEIDLMVYATGYKVTFPYMDRRHFQWIAKYPDLFLSSIHREYDNVCVLGIHQTNGGAYDFFCTQADMMCNFILDQEHQPRRAKKFKKLKKSAYPDLRGGMNYVKSDRHATYVHKATFQRYCDQLMRRYHWKPFGCE